MPVINLHEQDLHDGDEVLSVDDIHEAINNGVEYPMRALPFPDEYSWTDHVEMTITLACWLIQVGKGCPRCTAEMVQMQGESMLIRDESGLLKMDSEMVIAAHEVLKHMGINMITGMGGAPITISGYEDVVTSVGQDPTLEGLVYTASIPLLTPEMEPNRKFGKYEKAGLFDGAMYLNASVDHLVLSEADIPHGADVSYHKARAGLILMERLVRDGHETSKVGIHMVLRDDTIDDIIPLYEWAQEKGIWFGLCHTVFRPYLLRAIGTDNGEGKPSVSQENIPRLNAIIARLIEEESARIIKKEPRVLVPSSAFLRMSMSEHGNENTYSCREHRNGTPPNVFDVHPNGTLRACIAQDTMTEVNDCGGCSYIALDRGSTDFAPFDQPGDIAWRNAYVNTKLPPFRDGNGKCRNNLSFVINETGEAIPLHQHIIRYYSRKEAIQRHVSNGGKLYIEQRGNLTRDNMYNPEWNLFTRR